VNTNNRLGEENKNLCFQRYYDSFYKGLHEGQDYEKSSAGYAEWYHDCLPSDREARILDIGCGDGKFLFFLKRNGYVRAEGLELSPCLADIAGKRVGCPVHVVDDTIDFLSLNRGRYGTVTMNDVLEHIPKSDTISFLAAVRESLMPGGNLVVNVPQASGFTSLYCRYNDFTHETLFTEMSLRQVLLLAGFSDIRFIKEKWPLKLTPRHLSYRFSRWVWFLLLRLIYRIEQPGEIHPRSFQVRIVASATR
jgi:SAM-dependent methyltransferase